MSACRLCGCTDADCRQCIERTGEPCHWLEPDLCSACGPAAVQAEVAAFVRDGRASQAEVDAALKLFDELADLELSGTITPDDAQSVVGFFATLQLAARVSGGST